MRDFAGDEALRPLSAAGRARRILPFVAVAAVAYGLAFLPPRIGTRAIVHAGVVTLAIVAVMVFVPWRRLPAWTEALPALAYVVVVAILRNGGGGAPSGYAPLMLLPLLWLALFHGRTMLLVGLGVSCGVFVGAVAVGGGASSRVDVRQFLLIVGIAVILSLAVERAVHRSRRATSAERLVTHAMRQAYERERAAAERLRELDQTRSEFVATVSHELRTPLTSILGNVELLVDGDAGVLSRPQAKLLGAVERNSRRLLALIEDLLMLSRIEGGGLKINAQPVALRSVVNGALDALGPVRERRGVALAVDVPSEPILLYGDRAQLERVTINLLDNALKFTAPGGRARLEVRVADDGEHVRLTVADTGMGIPPDEVDRIFDRFFRSTRSREQASPGSGLGLAITKSIVERHGGQISVRPGDDGGTVVTCLLPRCG